MSSGNKRVSQLVELTAAETQNDDLFLVIDVSARESKKMQSSQLAAWLSLSGSLSVSHATTSDTASYVSISNVIGIITTASYAYSSSHASLANTSSQSTSASFSRTASFAINSGGGVGLTSGSTYNITSSWATNAVSTVLAQSASFLRYLGTSNGTASYALTTQNVDHATRADSASYFDNPLNPVATASFAERAGYVDSAGTASFLVYGPNNGTASYAITAGNISSNFINYGIFLAITQSTSQSFLDRVDIAYSDTLSLFTNVEAMGNVKIPFTASAPISGVLKLISINRKSGQEFFMDSSSIDINMSPIISAWGANATGTISLPFSLMGKSQMPSGSYCVFVSSSNNVFLEANRTVRFNISSKAETVDVSVDEPLQFSYTPPTTLIEFSSSITGGPYVDDNDGILSSSVVGSGSTNITWIDMGGNVITSVRQLWALPTMSGFVYAENSLNEVGGFPTSMSYFNCETGSIADIYDMSNIVSMSYFNCANNDLTALPTLPATMSYIQCSANSIGSLPSPMPYGLQTFICDQNQLLTVTSTLPNSIVSMSINNNTLLSSFMSALPTSLGYIDLSYSPVGNVPTIPATTTQLFFYSSSLSGMAMDTICATLVSNGASNGRLDIRGNGAPSPSALANISLLTIAGWTGSTRLNNMPSIPISGLNTFPTNISGSDFVPLVDSSSLTTYRGTIDALQLYLNTTQSSVPLLASSSISSSYSLFAKIASSSLFATSASWSSASLASVSASWASRSFAATSASWASASISSSFSISGISISSSWASSSFTSVSSSWASRSFAATSASWASSSVSASYALAARTASYATTSSYALTASVIVPVGGVGATKFFNNIGATWMVSNPGFAFANANDLYVYNYDHQCGRRNLCKINMQTNVVTYIKQWPQDAWSLYGHLFKSTNDGDPHAIFYSDSGLYDYDVTANTVTQLNLSAHYDDLPVIVDFTDALHPTVWALYGSWHAGNGGDYPSFYLRKHYWNGSAYTSILGSLLNLVSSNNASAMIPFFNSATGHQSVARNTYLWDYNYIKKRYYLITDGTGYLHLFYHTTGTPDTSWLASSVTYEKTLAIPVPHLEEWGDANTDRFFIDYDIDTGEEKGIIMIRRGLHFDDSPYQNLMGSVTYVNWPENGNW